MLRSSLRRQDLPLPSSRPTTVMPTVAKVKLMALQLASATSISDFLSLSNFVSKLLTVSASYYAWQFGYFLGANSRTPEVASVFADAKVLQGTFYPHEVRLYAWLLLWASLASSMYCAYTICRTLLADQAIMGGISPKLPMSSIKITPLSSMGFPSSPGAINRHRRNDSIGRLRMVIVLFVFALSFIKKQHVGTTIIFHPVNSPLFSSSSGNDSSATPTKGINNQDNADSDDRMPALKANEVAGYGNPRKSVPVVPRIVHFVFGMEPDFGGKPFEYPHYLSMYAAMQELKPVSVMFWHNYLPTSKAGTAENWWFERIQKDAVRFGVDLIMKEARVFDKIYDNPIVKFAHKADVIRLEALLQYGGIYLDLDVYAIRSFDSLLHFDSVLGLEGGVSGVPRQGLCNGVIVSAPNSTFLQRWHSSYRSFRDEKWAEHSVKLPLRLARSYPTELVVLDPFAMFYPLWNADGLRMAHSRLAQLGGDAWDFDDSQQLAYHAWSSFAGKKWLAKINPDLVFEVETSFNLLVRRWTSDDLRQQWRIARDLGLLDT